jgi:glutaredoxin
MNRVRLYGFEACPYCQELKEKFDSDNLDYIYVDIDLKENEAETKKVMEIAKTDSVPIILVNKVLLSPEVSFNSIEEAFDLTKKFLSEEK